LVDLQTVQELLGHIKIECSFKTAKELLCQIKIEWSFQDSKRTFCSNQDRVQLQDKHHIRPYLRQNIRNQTELQR
jgi:hypothetical protein